MLKRILILMIIICFSLSLYLFLFAETIDTFFAAEDAKLWHDVAAGAAWAVVRDGAGTDMLDDVNLQVILNADDEDGKWNSVRRAMLTFNTAALPDGATITAAKFRISSSWKEDDLSCTPDINVYSASPNDPTNLVIGDYDACGIDAYCDTTITYANWYNAPGAEWEEFEFNADPGLLAINKTGYTSISLREVTHDVGDTPPGWSDATSYLSGRSTDFDGGSLKPELVVTYTEADGEEGAVFFGANFAVLCLLGLLFRRR